LNGKTASRPWWARWFHPSTELGAAKAFLGFAGVVLVAIAVFLFVGWLDYALAAAWAAVLLEIGLTISGKLRLRIPFAIVVALFGSAVILLLASIKAP
jgi:hypothetical protein